MKAKKVSLNWVDPFAEVVELTTYEIIDCLPWSVVAVGGVEVLPPTLVDDPGMLLPVVVAS